MNYRQSVLLDTTNFSTSGTKKVDLDVQDVISRITVIAEVVNTDYTPTDHPLAVLTTVEIVDGSRVITSASGYAHQAMDFYDDGKIGHNELNYENIAVCRAAVSLNFGRWLYDEEFALDPKKFNNPQLKITHDYSLGGCSPSSVNLRVIADLFDEKVGSPMGYLRTQEIFSYTPVAGATEYIDIPTDMPIRKLLIMNTNDNEEPDIEFETVKISEDEGKRVIIDCLTMDLIRTFECQYPRLQEYLSGRADTSGADFFLSACKDIMLGVIGSSGTASYHHGAWSGGRKRSIKGSVTMEFGGQCSGRCIHGAVPILFGKQGDSNDWWDVSRIGKAQVKLTPRSGTTDTNKNNVIVGQFLDRY